MTSPTANMPHQNSGLNVLHPAPDRQIHVLLSAYACEPHKGSAPALGWNWAIHLSRSCRVTVLTRSNNRAPIEDWMARYQIQRPNLRFHYIDLPSPIRRFKRGQRGFWAYYAAWQFSALRAAQQIHVLDPFDLVHHVTFESVHGPIFLQRLPVPLIYGPVGGGEFAPPSFWVGGGIRASAYEFIRAGHATTGWYDPALRATVRGATRILVATPQTERFVPSALRHKTSIMSPVGIEQELVAPTRDQPLFKRANSGIRIYGVGRLVHWKGFDLAIRAFARAAMNHPAATFTILGSGPQGQRLRRLAEAEGVADRVRFEASLPRSDVLRLADESDIFLLPSLHDSGGVALVEAMARAKPVVVLDTGGPAVVVTPECGIKAPTTTPEEAVRGLAAGLDRLMADPALRQRMGDAARKRILDEFIWERKAEKMLGIYREVARLPVIGTSE